jgi:hypothetical protein
MVTVSLSGVGHQQLTPVAIVRHSMRIVDQARQMGGLDTLLQSPANHLERYKAQRFVSTCPTIRGTAKVSDSNKMNREWLLDMSYLVRLSLATVVAANYITAEVKVLHIVIEDL